VAHFFIPKKDDGTGRECKDIPVEVIQKFKDFDEEYFVFLNCKLQYEADIILFHRSLIHVIEVKDYGGKVSIDENGVWKIEPVGKEPFFLGLGINRPTPLRQVATTAEDFDRKISRFLACEMKNKVRPITLSYVLFPTPNPEIRAELRNLFNRKAQEMKEKAADINYQGKLEKNYPSWVLLLDSQDRLLENLHRREDKKNSGQTEKDRESLFTEEIITQMAEKWKMVEKNKLKGIVLNEYSSQEKQSQPSVQPPPISTINRPVVVMPQKPLSVRLARMGTKWIIPLSLALVCLVLLFAFSGVFLPRGCFTGSSLNVRTSPAGSVAGTVKSGVCFRFNGKSDGWLRIGGINQYRGDWVSSQYFNVDVNLLKEVR
jgi:hypothetical protein